MSQDKDEGRKCSHVEVAVEGVQTKKQFKDLRAVNVSVRCKSCGEKLQIGTISVSWDGYAAVVTTDRIKD